MDNDKTIILIETLQEISKTLSNIEENIAAIVEAIKEK